MAIKKFLPDIEQKVLEFIRRNNLVSAGQKLLVAVSGGPDSVCLLHILFRLREELNIELHAAHLNHLLRGAESVADAGYVTELCHRLGIPATVEEEDVAAYQAQNRLSLEEAAREVRYRFLARTARDVGAGRVAVGHTADDHTETILLHIIRGTGTRGLRGLQPLTSWRFSGLDITLVRPLLEVTREETVEYCRLHRLEPRSDSSNESLSFLRNRVRHELLPLLREYNPAISSSLNRLSRTAGDELAFLDRECVRQWDSLIQRQNDSLIIEKKGLLNLSPALQRHLLRLAIENLLGSLKDIETRHIEEIMDSLAKPAGKQVSLPGGLVFSIDYRHFSIGRNPDDLVPFPELEGEFPLQIPGETVIPGWTIQATITTHEGKTPVSVESAAGPEYDARMDADIAGSALILRAYLPGDRFQPLGMGQTKKVGEFMLDSRIPRSWRKSIPLICSPRQILWVVGCRIDERAKVTENTQRVLTLKAINRKT
jgi:tRNA(Ile)-lysidine synthase